MAVKKILPKEAGTKRFSKEQWMSAGQYREQQDLLQALLKDGQAYTPEEVEARLRVFLEKEM